MPRLAPAELHQLQALAAAEVVNGVRAGADTAILREFVQVYDRAARLLARHPSTPAGMLENRQAVFVDRDPAGVRR